jgi:hypothetical protein
VTKLFRCPQLYNTSKCTQNYWVFGLCPSSGNLETIKQNVLELDLFQSSGERETPTLLGPLERAHLNHLPFSGEGRETRTINPVIHHRQNPLESKNKIWSSNFGVLGLMNLDDIYEVLFVLKFRFII